MDTPYFRCEDCGHEFAKTEFMPDVEDEDVPECPECGGLDVQLIDKPRVSDSRSQAAA